MAAALAVLFLLGQVAALASPAEEGEEKTAADWVQRGDEAFRRGRYSAAVQSYRSALECDASDFTARLKLIELLARLAGREDEARKEMEAALAISSLTVEEIGMIAEICRDQAFREEARSAYARLLEKEPGNLSALGNLVDLLLSQEDFGAARKEIEAYKESPGSTLEGLEMLAARCTDRSRYRLAKVAYEGMLEREERNLRALLGLADCLVKLGEFSGASETLSRAAEGHPEEVKPAIALGNLLALTGQYAPAEKAFKKALRIDTSGAEAARGLARVMVSTGRYSEARRLLSEAVGRQPDSATLRTALGRLLNYAGEYEGAREQFQKALEARPGNPRAILGLALSYRETGKLHAAKEQFFRLYDFWDRHLDDLDSVAGEDMVAVAIACALTDNPQDALDVLEQVLKREPRNPEALLWEARLFAERHQPADAARELGKLLAMNPNHPEANAEQAGIHFDSSQYDKAAESCQRALKTNPNLIRALDILCSIQILDFEYEEAEETAKKALTINPRSLSSLSALASCYWQKGNKTAYHNVRKRVLEINPAYAEFYLTVARTCENKRRNEEAIALLKEAIALNSEYAPPYTSVGIILMREGEEEQAEKYLRKSFQLDSYNPRTTNFINLLQHMKKTFVSTRTEHFLLRWHREKGSVLSSFLPQHVEEVYAEICEEFGYEPKNPTLVEIFDSHDQFSARIVGLPFIATVGASLGKVVALDSPKEGSFDWKDVLRHEFVHVVNLQQSRMQIPFWFTEGLATSHEDSPFPAEWDRLTTRMVYLGRIIPLKELNSYFTRPETLGHKQAAYAESNLICRYFYREFGLPVIRKMIEMYGQNFSTDEVIRKCLSMSAAEFEGKISDYVFAHAKAKRVAPLFLKGDEERIAAALKKKPEDSLLRVARARLLFQTAQAARSPAREARWDEAVKILEEVIQDDREARGAYSTLGEIYLVRGEHEKAKDAALEAIAIDEKDFVAHRCLGVLYQKTGEKEEAILELEKAAELYPRDAGVWTALARLYSEQENEEGMIRALEGEARGRGKNVLTLKRLARSHLSGKDYDKAVEVLEKALRYNLYDPEVYRLLVESLNGKGDAKSAAAYAKTGAEAAYIAAKSLMPFHRDRVMKLLDLALLLNPEHERAKSLRNTIGGGIEEDKPATGAEEVE